MSNQALFDLTGKVALVTGASRGIGEYIAKTLAKSGATVLVSSRKIDGCQAVVDEILADGGKAHAIPCHIGEMEQIETLFEQIKIEFGQLDILVNNAAANPYFGHILETDLMAYQKTVDVNIRGYFFMSKLGAQMMKEQGGGAIVNVASVNGVIPGDLQGIYSITKAAVISMTKAFAKECAQFNIRVNALLPGATDTKFASALVKNPKILEQAMAHVPMRRVAQPEEMAGTVLYLVSDAASYTTGSCINVDGGYLLG
ncbi:short-chain dehydrogenase [Thalassotalea loyana]|uniref:Short-chain dehydrogenase n=1 Tax=Thalassotalea loyana TaxID=280483 RepID=A0ABQ6HED2_9GAMM|nr:SDR family oxidoreductase [Thalassotalea loyana]GLX85789.1 short-chain dehydrogenase [Thalassotalea loyana]